MSGNNPYEALRREASAPGTQVVEPDAKVQTIPAPETVRAWLMVCPGLLLLLNAASIVTNASDVLCREY